MKRPEKEEFLQKYKEFNEDKRLLTEYYNCSLKSIYRWISLYRDEVVSDFDLHEKEKNFDDYVDYHLQSLVKPRNREINVSLNRDILLVPIADTHLGSIYSKVKELQKDLHDIENLDGVYIVFLGDVIDYSIDGPKDLLYDQVFPSPKYARDWAMKMFEMIGHKTLTIISGCHDNWQYRQNGEYLGDILAKTTITKVFVPDSLIMNLKLNDVPYKIFMTHKLLSHSKLNPTHGLLRKAREDIDFDLGIAAHNHTPAITKMFIRQKDITAVKCGPYKGLDTYGGKLGITDNPSSIPGIFLSSKTRSIIPFFNWREGLPLLKGDQT